MNLILATRNAHKTREFRELLGNQFTITDLASSPSVTLPEETGRTFEENAIIKALSVSQTTNQMMIADDSGLEVDALRGAPGIYSARYAGDNAIDTANVAKLLREMNNRPDRSARFRCVIALAHNGKIVGTFEGVVEGTITDVPRGTAGFGYDPIFQPTGFEQTFAEMSAELKNGISHRAKAATALRKRLSEIRY